MPCPNHSAARPLTPDEQIGGLQRSLFNALAEAERLRAALAVVEKHNLIPVKRGGEYRTKMPIRPCATTAYPASDTPEGALLGAQAEIERRDGK